VAAQSTPGAPTILAEEVPTILADIVKAKTKLGFQPTTSIDLGIPRFVQWYLSYHGLARPQGGQAKD
jgi:nucleoside-diphosphate-sugar epimerase